MGVGSQVCAEDTRWDDKTYPVFGVLVIIVHFRRDVRVERVERDLLGCNARERLRVQLRLDAGGLGGT